MYTAVYCCSPNEPNSVGTWETLGWHRWTWWCRDRPAEKPLEKQNTLRSAVRAAPSRDTGCALQPRLLRWVPGWTLVLVEHWVVFCCFSLSVVDVSSLKARIVCARYENSSTHTAVNKCLQHHTIYRIELPENLMKSADKIDCLIR